METKIRMEVAEITDSSLERFRDSLYEKEKAYATVKKYVRELEFITAEAVLSGRAEISMKGKNRIVILPEALRKKLKSYMKEAGIRTGVVFRTRSGRPMDRSNIWSDMKKLCKTAEVDRRKVFPHSLRHLFARSYYSMDKDLARLADILGHSSIETTRIYVTAGVSLYEKTMRRMRLVL